MSEATGVSHVTTGLRKILEFSFVYNFWQRITGSESAKRKIIQNHVQPFSKAKWLDIGCGTGALLEHVDTKLEIDFVGYDLNPEYITFAKNKYATRGRFYCTSINGAKLFEENFDIATAIAIVHHLNDMETEKLFELARKSISPSGVFFLAEPVWTDKQSKLEKYLMSKDRGQSIRHKEEYVRLAEKTFSKIESFILPKLYNIPWTVCVLKCSS